MLPSSLITASHKRRGQNGSRSEIAYRALKHKIVISELAPATILSEAELIAELGIGRTPLREALQRLAYDDLVVILPRRGTMVTDLNPSDLLKIFEIRVELEPFAVRLASERATELQIGEMENLLEACDEFVDPYDYHQLILLDQQIHWLLGQASNNSFLAETLERYYTHVMRLWYVSLHEGSRLREAIQEHADIIASVKVGDGLRAAAIMRAHITKFQSDFAGSLVASNTEQTVLSGGDK